MSSFLELLSLKGEGYQPSPDLSEEDRARVGDYMKQRIPGMNENDLPPPPPPIPPKQPGVNPQTVRQDHPDWFKSGVNPSTVRQDHPDWFSQPDHPVRQTARTIAQLHPDWSHAQIAQALNLLHPE